MSFHFTLHTNRVRHLNHSSPHIPFPNQAPVILSCAGKDPSECSHSFDTQEHCGHHMMPTPTSSGGDQQETLCAHLHQLGCVAVPQQGWDLQLLPHSPHHLLFFHAPPVRTLPSLHCPNTWRWLLFSSWQLDLSLLLLPQQSRQDMKWNPCPVWRGCCCCDTPSTTRLSILGYHSCKRRTCIGWCLAPFCASGQRKGGGRRERSDTFFFHLMKAKSDGGGRGGETDWALRPSLINACFEKKKKEMQLCTHFCWFLGAFVTLIIHVYASCL